MAQNYVNSCERMEITAGATIASGDGVLVGNVFGVALGKGVSGDKIVLATEGVFILPKAAVGITQGAKLYWDATNKVLTTTASGNMLVALAWKAAASGAATVEAALYNGI